MSDHSLSDTILDILEEEKEKKSTTHHPLLLKPGTIEYYTAMIQQFVASCRRVTLARYEVEVSRHELELAEAAADHAFRLLTSESTKKPTDAAIKALCTRDEHVQSWQRTLIEKVKALGLAEADAKGLEWGIKFELALLRQHVYEEQSS